jgi:hypothetical protein
LDFINKLSVKTNQLIIAIIHKLDAMSDIPLPRITPFTSASIHS